MLGSKRSYRCGIAALIVSVIATTVNNLISGSNWTKIIKERNFSAVQDNIITSSRKIALGTSTNNLRRAAVGTVEATSEPASSDDDAIERNTPSAPEGCLV